MNLKYDTIILQRNRGGVVSTLTLQAPFPIDQSGDNWEEVFDWVAENYPGWIPTSFVLS